MSHKSLQSELFFVCILNHGKNYFTNFLVNKHFHRVEINGQFLFYFLIYLSIFHKVKNQSPNFL